MKDSKSSKGKAIVGTIVTLTAATVMMMAPMSQAQAGGDPNSRSVRVKTQDTKCDMKYCITRFRVEGGGRNRMAALATAQVQIYCNDSKETLIDVKSSKSGTMYNNTWYYQDYTYGCKRPAFQMGRVG